jgi:hypothetical protein
LKISVKDGALIAGAWAVSLALIYNLCHLIFRCGCSWAWAGAASRCNVHNPAPPHCPWCCHGLAGFLWVPAIILPAEAAVILGLRKRGTLAQIAGAAVTYLVVGAAAGLLSALLDGYPRWLGITLR